MVVIIIIQLLESPLLMLPVQYGMYSKLWLLSLLYQYMVHVLFMLSLLQYMMLLSTVFRSFRCFL